MRLEDLADVHARRHAERVQHDVDRLAVGEEGHVLLWHDARDHALVAVAARHLVAGLDLALHLVEEAAFQPLLRLVVLFAHRFDFAHQLVVFDGEGPPLRPREFLDRGARQLRVLPEALRAGHRRLADQHVGETRVDVAVEDREFVVAVLGELLDLLALDRLGALVLVDAVAVEHAHFAHFDDRALHARRHAQRRVAHVRRLLAEDGAQELLFRRHRAFALRRDLADEDVSCRRGCRPPALRRRCRRCRLRRDSSAPLPKRSECRA